MRIFFTFSLIVFFLPICFSQYIVNGNATQLSCNCYRLTEAINYQSGSVWNSNKIDLSQSFDFTFSVFLGCSDGGADGIAFVLQPISTVVGSTGGGLGYQGISPALGVTIDTYQNSDMADPSFDHIAIQLNGNLNHNNASTNIAGPVTAINGNDNIEDCANHILRVSWDAVTHIINVYMDASLRLTATNDLVTNVFGGNPLVYWGFTGGTGGLNNEQKFCTSLIPSYHFSTTQTRCLNTPITFFDSTISFTTLAKIYWDFGDGSPIDSININPTHTYISAGTYTVIQRVKGADGCEATNTQTIIIGSKPIASFGYNDTCVVNTITFTDQSTNTVGNIATRFWDFGNGNTSNLSSPSTSYATNGNKLIKLAVQSEYGCPSDTIFKTIHIFAKPNADFTFIDSVCLGSPMLFTDATIANAGEPLTSWIWNFNEPPITSVYQQNASYTFLNPGVHTVQLITAANGVGGCEGILEKNVFVVNKPIAAIKNINKICQQVAINLQDSSYTLDGAPINNWWWNLGNGNTTTLQNPTTTYNTYNPYTVSLVAYANGCVSDTLKKTISINAKPTANFGFGNTLCTNKSLQFSDSSFVFNNGSIVGWQWLYNGTGWSNVQNPTHIFNAGNQTVGLIATSFAGCISDTTFKTFTINTSPTVSINFSNACKNSVVPFSAIDNPTGLINNWYWSFGDGSTSLNKNPQHIFTTNGNYVVKLLASSTNGCVNDTIKRNIIIYGTDAFAGNDTNIVVNQPLQLNATGGLSYTWLPSTGLSNANIANPIATLNHSQKYILKAYTPDGCETYDSININVYNKIDIMLPNAFSPNGDGVNDFFSGIPAGMKTINYITIYNRYGERLFTTSNYLKGWDGRYKGQLQEVGTYVYIANGIDFNGHTLNKKGTFLLVK